MRTELLIATMLLGSCGAESETSAPKPNHVLAEQIVDPAAPTVSELTKRGLVRVDDEPAGWTGPKGETIDGFTAIYMGKEVARPLESDLQFICPVGIGDMDNWKCQPVKANNG